MYMATDSDEKENIPQNSVPHHRRKDFSYSDPSYSVQDWLFSKISINNRVYVQMQNDNAVDMQTFQTRSHFNLTL